MYTSQNNRNAYLHEEETIGPVYALWAEEPKQVYDSVREVRSHLVTLKFLSEPLVRNLFPHRVYALSWCKPVI